MSVLEKMKVFKESELLKSDKIVQQPSVKEESLISYDTEEVDIKRKILLLNKFQEIYGNKLTDYVTKNMTKKELCLYEEAFLLDSENPKRLSMLNLSEKQLEQMVRGFRQYVDLAEEIQSGISDNDLDILLLAIKMEVSLNELFTEDGRFIDYKKIKILTEKAT